MTSRTWQVLMEASIRTYAETPGAIVFEQFFPRTLGWDPLAEPAAGKWQQKGSSIFSLSCTVESELVSRSTARPDL